MGQNLSGTATPPRAQGYNEQNGTGAAAAW